MSSNGDIIPTAGAMKARGYEQCLKEAKERRDKGTLKLCPRGYCTAKHK